MPEAGETGETVQGRQTEEHTTITPCNIFPNTFPENSLLLLTPTLLFYLPWDQALPPPHLHLLSVDFPAHCPLTFNLNIPPPSAQTRIRTQRRNQKMYSGGERGGLRCSFQCFVYLFLLLIFVLHHIIAVFSKTLIIYWNEKIFKKKIFFFLSLTLFSCHCENKFALTHISQTHSFVKFPRGLFQNVKTQVDSWGEKHIFIT